MKNKLIEILRNHELNVESIEAEIDEVLHKAEECIKITKQSLEQLRGFVFTNTFKNKEEEIDFFKNIKPQVYSKLIYYVKLFSIESKRPRSSSKSQTKFFNNHIDRLQTYFNDNLEFYHYYRRGATFLDEQYFLRGKADIRLFPDTFHFFTDRQFSTSHDSTVAIILAYDMLIVHLKKEIDKLENTNNGMETINSPSPILSSKLFWTGSKTDLIELIYALHDSGAINSGTADIKKMAAVCEQVFNIDLGDYYRTFLEIKSRKINQTKFLDRLKTVLLEHIEKSEE